MASLRKFAKFTPYLPLLVIAIALLTEGVTPARAQAPHATPTPYPAISATRQAAEAQLDNARRQQAQAAQMDAQAAEMRRNAEVQQAQAAQGIADARAAAVAQNALSFGEAIGRAESNVAALKASVEGLTQINATGAALVKVQAQQIISLTIEAQQLRVSVANYQAVNEVQSLAIAEAQRATPSPLIPMVVIALLLLGLLVAVVVVLQRRAPDGHQSYNASEVTDVIDAEA